MGLAGLACRVPPRASGAIANSTKWEAPSSSAKTRWLSCVSRYFWERGLPGAPGEYFVDQPIVEDNAVREPSSALVNARFGWRNRDWEIALSERCAFSSAEPRTVAAQCTPTVLVTGP